MTDRHQFDVTYRGQWYRLGSLSDHVRERVDPTGPVRIIYDRTCRSTLVPAAEVQIPCRPIAWPKRNWRAYT